MSRASATSVWENLFSQNPTLFSQLLSALTPFVLKSLWTHTQTYTYTREGHYFIIFRNSRTSEFPRQGHHCHYYWWWVLSNVSFHEVNQFMWAKHTNKKEWFHKKEARTVSKSESDLEQNLFVWVFMTSALERLATCRHSKWLARE